MKLSKEEKDYLKQLVKSKWFEVLEKIYEEKKISLLNNFMSADLWNEQTRYEIYWTQNFVKGMKEILLLANSNTVEKVSKIESLR